MARVKNRGHINEARDGSHTVAGALAGLVSVALLAGCLPTAERSIGVDPAHATSVELYEYAFSEQPTKVDRVIITEPGLVAEILHGFTDMPGEQLFGDRSPARCGSCSTRNDRGTHPGVVEHYAVVIAKQFATTCPRSAGGFVPI